MLPAFWVIGLECLAFGCPLWRRRVSPNPYFGLTLGDRGDRDDVWYPVNTLFGRDLVFLGARILVVMTVLATFAWRRPQHYLLVCGCVLAAEAILLVGRWRLLGKALRRLQDAETREERG